MNGFKFTNTGTLAVMILVIMAFCGDAGQYLAMAAALVWLFAKVLSMYRPCKAVAQKSAAAKPSPKPTTAQPAPGPAAAKPAPQPTATKPQASAGEALDYEMKVVLLRHINCRITEQLQGAFPGATWRWENAEPAQAALRGECARIRTFGTGERNFADIWFDRAGHIRLDMLTLTPLKEFKAENKQPDSTDSDEINLRDWYDLSASAAVRATIDEVYTRGHKRLYIDADGMLYVMEGEQRVKAGVLDHLPGKNLWADLVPCFAEDDITATVTEDCIALTWAN